MWKTPILCIFCLVLGLTWTRNSLAKINYDIKCSKKWMTVDIDMKKGISQLYLDKLKGYPACYPTVKNNRAQFRLPLVEFYKCAVTKVIEKHTGTEVYYHRIVAETSKGTEMVLVSCEIGGNATLSRPSRQALPPGFIEPETITISEYIEAKAPIPNLSLAVRQNGRIVDTTLNVEPGALLQMDISLDENSADTYGLLASFLKVTDNTPQKEEVIIQDGCAIDPYIFDNFYTADGDYLTAKFRAFKFPNTNFVLFIGTVNVCLQRCQGVPCGNGQIGYGRRKRATSSENDPNKAFDVVLSTLVRVERSAKSKDFPPINTGSLAGTFDGQQPDLPEYKENGDEKVYESSSSSLFLSTFVLLFVVLSQLLSFMF